MGPSHGRVRTISSERQSCSSVTSKANPRNKLQYCLLGEFDLGTFEGTHFQHASVSVCFQDNELRSKKLMKSLELIELILTGCLIASEYVNVTQQITDV